MSNERWPRCGDAEVYGDGQGAKSKRSGGPCRNRRVRGATRCRMHGGTRQLAPPGSPERGGRPITHGYYSDVLDEQEQQDYESGSELLGILDAEIRFSRAKLKGCERRRREAEDRRIAPGDITGDGPKGTNYETWDQGARLWLDTIRKLEVARKQLEDGDDREARGAVIGLLESCRKRRRG